MAKPINPKCLHCSNLVMEQVYALHGVGSSDPCWNPKRCLAKRHNYRKRQKEIRGVSSDPVLLMGPQVEKNAGILILYRDREDAPVHAVGAEIWCGNRKVGEMQTHHCMGMRSHDLKRHLKQMLETLEAEFGIQKFAYDLQDPFRCVRWIRVR